MLLPLCANATHADCNVQMLLCTNVTATVYDQISVTCDDAFSQLE